MSEENTAIAVLAHQDAKYCDALARHWQKLFPKKLVFILHGGSEEDFDGISYELKAHCPSDFVGGQNMQSAKQSLMPCFKAMQEFLRDGHFAMRQVLFAEYDFVPLRAEFLKVLERQFLNSEADLLGHRLRDITDTNDAHFLYHLADERFVQHWRGKRIFSFLIPGSLWSVDLIRVLATCGYDIPSYFEIALPSLAYDLGFALANYAGDEVVVDFEYSKRVSEALKSEKTLAIHPVKDYFVNNSN